MELTGVHLLLTYQCILECDHCFVWGSPWQSGTMTEQSLKKILAQAKELGTVEWIYFEGGEPFLYYAVLVRSVRMAARLGFRVGIVSNGYWATDVMDAMQWLRPFAGRVQDLSISGDSYHWSDLDPRARVACTAGEKLGIPVGVIRIARPEATSAAAGVGQPAAGEAALKYRGRAAEKLVDRAGRRPWRQFTACPYEDLREPGRVHVDPLGNVHICQGISLGNVFRTPLREICEGYDPDTHPVTAPLLQGGPAGLVRRYGLPHQEGHADACHLCYEARCSLRPRFPEILAPDQMYGVRDAP